MSINSGAMREDNYEVDEREKEGRYIVCRKGDERGAVRWLFIILGFYLGFVITCKTFLKNT